MKLKVIAVLVVLVQCVLSCTLMPERSSFEQHYTAWKSSNIVNYSFKYNRSGMQLPPVYQYPMTITVANGAVASVIDNKGVTLDSTDQANAMYFLTITDCFESLKTALYGNEQIAAASKVEVSYDSATHIPCSVYIDGKAGAADDEWGWTISEFTIK
jgi:hypothetical protein